MMIFSSLFRFDLPVIESTSDNETSRFLVSMSIVGGLPSTLHVFLVLPSLVFSVGWGYSQCIVVTESENMSLLVLFEAKGASLIVLIPLRQHVLLGLCGRDGVSISTSSISFSFSFSS